jgi:hypothetical protein
LLSRIDSLLDKFWHAFAEQQLHDRFIKKCAYKKTFIPHNILIKVQSNDLDNSIEFARILCAAIDEELYSDAYIYTDRNNVEVETTIYGPNQLSTQAVLELCNILSEKFEVATKKIGSCRINTIICPNKKSNYQELDIKLAQACYNRFHLKFIDGQNNGN